MVAAIPIGWMALNGLAAQLGFRGEMQRLASDPQGEIACLHSICICLHIFMRLLFTLQQVHFLLNLRGSRTN